MFRIFRRYADENLRLSGRGTSLGADGRIDSQRLERNRLILEGWTGAERIGLRLNRVTIWTTPALAGPDPGLRGFTLDLPFEIGTPEILIHDADGIERATPLPAIAPLRLKLARHMLFIPYVGALFGLIPQLWSWKRGGDLGAREIVKERLGLVPRSDAVEMERDALVPTPLPPVGFACTTVVIPVYNAFDLLPEVLSRAERHADLPIRLIVIEDASPDPKIRPWLRDWAQDPARIHPVTLLENPENLGFIRSVNRGIEEALARHPDDPVVLLNSDALLPAGWTSRLIAPLAGRDVASVTPMSNDAEIFNVPVICRRGCLPPGLADALDEAARSLPAHPIEAPTGVGFCMAMAPGFLARLPALDTIFGRGYGEETDWCQRARALGGRHLGIANLFVEHRGGSSFGSEAKLKLLAKNGAEISRRYPHYDAEVQGFIRNDPMTTARLALGLSWAALRQSGPVSVWLAHAMGGGAENDLKRRISDEIAQGAASVVLRVGQGHRWKLELHTAEGVTQGLSNDLGLIRDLIARLPRRRILYSCGVGERDPLLLPDLLLDLAGRGDDPLPGGPQAIEVLVHDFFMVSPSYTLMGKNHAYAGPPRPETPAGNDPTHSAERPGGVAVALADWQAHWGRLMALADKITVFSDSSRAIITEVYPEAAGAIRVEPHALLTAIPAISPAHHADGRVVLGALGNIGVQKGAAVLQDLSRRIARTPGLRDRLGLVVIGQLDPAYRLSAPAQVHGSYEWRDLPGLVARYGITHWIIPSVWPETFSFTTHEAIATGMPVIAFDLGAQADALKAAKSRGMPAFLLPPGPPAIISADAVLALPRTDGEQERAGS